MQGLQISGAVSHVLFWNHSCEVIEGAVGGGEIAFVQLFAGFGEDEVDLFVADRV